MSSKRKPAHPLLVVLSAPSGAGKTTLATRLLARRRGLRRSVSCTTRKPRGAERDGVEYHFVSRKDFLSRVKAGEFLEHAEVHGNHYGTLCSTVEGALQHGHSLLLVIDVQGAAQVRRQAATLPAGDLIRHGFVDVFVEPPSLQALKERLEGRGEDGVATIRKRVRNARAEMKRAKDFKYVIVNDNLDEAVRRLMRILDHEEIHAGQ